MTGVVQTEEDQCRAPADVKGDRRGGVARPHPARALRHQGSRDAPGDDQLGQTLQDRKSREERRWHGHGRAFAARGMCASVNPGPRAMSTLRPV